MGRIRTLFAEHIRAIENPTDGFAEKSREVLLGYADILDSILTGEVMKPKEITWVRCSDGVNLKSLGCFSWAEEARKLENDG